MLHISPVALGPRGDQSRFQTASLRATQQVIRLVRRAGRFDKQNRGLATQSKDLAAGRRHAHDISRQVFERRWGQLLPRVTLWLINTTAEGQARRKGGEDVEVVKPPPTPPDQTNRAARANDEHCRKPYRQRQPRRPQCSRNYDDGSK
jgi:hypothetical protein